MATKLKVIPDHTDVVPAPAPPNFDVAPPFVIPALSRDPPCS